MVCGQIEPRFHKQLCPLKHKLLAKTYTHPHIPTLATQEVTTWAFCLCCLINNKNRIPMIRPSCCGLINNKNRMPMTSPSCCDLINNRNMLLINNKYRMLQLDQQHKHSQSPKTLQHHYGYKKKIRITRNFSQGKGKKKLVKLIHLSIVNLQLFKLFKLFNELIIFFC